MTKAGFEYSRPALVVFIYSDIFFRFEEDLIV